MLAVVDTRAAEVAREHGWHLPKSLDSDENFKTEHMLFCPKLRFVAIYALFGDLWAKKVPFGSKTVFLGQEVHYYRVYIAYYTELNFSVTLLISNSIGGQNKVICGKTLFLADRILF